MSVDEIGADANGTEKRILSTAVNPATPYTYHLQSLLVLDPNPLPPNPTEEVLTAAARDATQGLLNKLLTTCPANSTSTSVILKLPSDAFQLPREKALPKPKPLTTWQKFAAKKGILPKKRDDRTKKVYDEATGEWINKWGYGKKKEEEDQWIVEVNDKMQHEESRTGRNVRNLKRSERVEKVKRAQRKERANVKKAGR